MEIPSLWLDRFHGHILSGCTYLIPTSVFSIKENVESVGSRQILVGSSSIRHHSFGNSVTESSCRTGFSTVHSFLLAMLPVIFLWNVKINLRAYGFCFWFCVSVSINRILKHLWIKSHRTGACAIIRAVLSARSKKKKKKNQT